MDGTGVKQGNARGGGGGGAGAGGGGCEPGGARVDGCCQGR